MEGHASDMFEIDVLLPTGCSCGSVTIKLICGVISNRYMYISSGMTPNKNTTFAKFPIRIVHFFKSRQTHAHVVIMSMFLAHRFRIVTSCNTEFILYRANKHMIKNEVPLYFHAKMYHTQNLILA